MTEDPAGDGAVIISLLPPAPPIATEVKSSFHIGELELYISFSRRFRNLKDNSQREHPLKYGEADKWRRSSPWEMVKYKVSFIR